MARRNNRGRKVNGILLLDKPIGLTSNAALQKVKRLYDAQKAGHTGSLDPLATGVLPLCFGEATKFSQFLLDANKRYVTAITLGISTTTGDAEGEVLQTQTVTGFESEFLEQTLNQFRGEIEQIPSMYSAIKVNGQPLYKLARQGIEIERKSRTVNILELNVVENVGPRLVLDIHCTKGTYIRSLAEDLGKILGCGAHVSELRRVASGPFELNSTLSIESLEKLLESDGLAGLDALLLSPALAVQAWPKVELSDIGASYLKQGQPVQIAQAPASGWVRLFSESSGEGDAGFIGVGEIIEDGRVAPRRLVATQ
ncbi:MAG: tRNA pseudouridine(55) synthase TruB [Pseudomonadales bacterium]|nr:tRNA pseudouridine(55) synthase TruB [Pseudomonadales bacterium]